MAGKIIGLVTRRTLAEAIADQWARKAQLVCDIEAGMVTEHWLFESLGKQASHRDRLAKVLVELGVEDLPAPKPTPRTREDPHAARAVRDLETKLSGRIKAMS